MLMGETVFIVLVLVLVLAVLLLKLGSGRLGQVATTTLAQWKCSWSVVRCATPCWAWM